MIDIGYKALNRTDVSEVSELEGLMTMHRSFQQQVAQWSMQGKATNEKAAWDAAMDEALLTNPFWSSWAQALKKFASAVPKELIEEARDMNIALFKARGSGRVVMMMTTQNSHMRIWRWFWPPPNSHMRIWRWRWPTSNSHMRI